MEIVKASLKDVALINKLAGQVWESTYRDILSAAQLEYMFSMMYSPKSITEQLEIKGHQYLLIKDETYYCGFASYEINYKPGVTKIHKLYVLPQTQGKGVGSLLLGAIEREARNNGNSIITLNVNRFNVAFHFYNKKGFIKTGTEDIDIGSGYLMEDYIMEKEIR
ncbi:GNAT family N-acetyltransferase [Flavobacterium salilacus subsp. salilacus]|uniref:GNAT family N-acetyltransferase n=1 Tax=Flavobacterium TaxID=237 RepID=UPI0010754CBA|nr:MULTISPECIES: GNAT family N-acetyltransferase [Flavobacterium]KAF2519296.1 GNAT family N-acetyltransferase [Flavobacterium salilacus subsp. salilacus]MBE1613486.1 GNAT family N-acetyltransferase [Flavobacterium sp. SaA2.13]